MTIVLKEIPGLEKHLNETLKIMLQNKDVKQLADMPANRKHPLQFLLAVMKMAAELSKKTQDPTPKYLYYGAVFVSIQYMKDHLGYGESLGLLNNRLIDSIDLTEDNTPDDSQYLLFYSTLNLALNQMYKYSNSETNSFATDSVFSFMPVRELVKFAKISYAFEETAQNNITKAYIGDAKTKANAKEFVLHKYIKESYVNTYTFSGLKDRLNTVKLNELADKSVASIDQINDVNRVRQLKTLLAVEQILDSSNLKEDVQKSIYAGFMLLIREDIATTEYHLEPFSIKPVNSEVHKGLSKIIDIKNLTYEKAEALINAAKNFLTYMTIEDYGTEKAAVREEHMFSKIAGFDLSKTLLLAEALIKAARTKTAERCEKKVIKQTEPEKGVWSAFNPMTYIRGEPGAGAKKPRKVVQEESSEDSSECSTSYSS